MKINCSNCKQESFLYFSAKDYNRKITSKTFDYYKCSKCGLIFLFPIPPNLGDYYTDQYYALPSSLEELVPYIQGERYKIDIIKKFKTNGQLLEIGPGIGGFSCLAKNSGFDVDVLEMDSKCCRFLEDIVGVKAINSNDPPKTLKEINKNYDVIALWHNIEHLPNPWDTLEAISEKLSLGGILIIAAPNPEAFQFRILGRFWPHVDAPRHLSLIPLGVIIQKMHLLGIKKVWSTTRDKGTLCWNSFGWKYFFSNFSKKKKIKIGLNAVGWLIAKVLFPVECMNGFGSAYTAVFRKE